MSIYYPVDKHILNADNLTKLADASDILKTRDDLNITIHGYSSKTGNQERNQKLSIWRAHGVEKQLYLTGIDLSRMDVDFSGDIEQTADLKGQRVDITFQWSKSNDSTESQSSEVKFGIFSERVTASDLAQVKASLDSQDLTKLHHIELTSFAKPPGDREGLIELAAKRAKKAC